MAVCSAGQYQYHTAMQANPALAITAAIMLSACNLVFSSTTDGGISAGGSDGVVPTDSGPNAVPSYIGPGDFDNDGMTNDKDPCPEVSHQTPADTDDDGIPNDCDPDRYPLNPFIPPSKDCLVLFDGFTGRGGVALDSRWTKVVGTTAVMLLPVGMFLDQQPITVVQFNQPLFPDRIDVTGTYSSNTAAVSDAFGGVSLDYQNEGLTSHYGGSA